MKSEDLIAYCGVSCGTCARWCDYSEFRTLAAVLAEWVDAQGYQFWMPTYAKDFDYTEFRKGLDFFSRNDTWLVCHNCCKGGDGNPECEIRKCCEKRGLNLCFDCEEFPCDKVERDKKMVKRGEKYRELGKDEWVRQQAEKAKQGFELHTGKYYQIYAKEHPPPHSSNG
ncbi:DUF3795 domain-containing protein [candidate division TA06 bacterium]|uniref:DUF3795 domain-containing protein n=1 Tax=candidate division TA06 bacterium TaxID=2250710 RepID=A0A523UTG6_UNCT6|nr:MAG: DUF3795 domain-containing protein [candidate division TA06 bacterium]